MSEPRFLATVFCDDVRNEVGNKITLVGCYGADLIVERIPVALPKFGVLARVYTPVDQPFDRLILRLRMGDSVLAELPVQPGGSGESASVDAHDARWQVLNAVLAISPLFIETECSLRVEAETEDGPLIGPQLRVRVAGREGGSADKAVASAPAKRRVSKRQKK